MVKNPNKFIKTNSPSEEPCEKRLKFNDFPAGRGPQDEGSDVQPVLTANMTGQVTLSGNFFDLQFNKGRLQGILHTESKTFLRLCSKSYFRTSTCKSKYRNESAFALETEFEYGLRSLQIDRKNKNMRRIITDFFFSRETGSCYIAVSIEYPEFSKDEIMEVSAPLELRLEFDDTETKIRSDKEPNPVFCSKIIDTDFIKGNLFNICSGGRVLELSYIDKYKSRRFSIIKGLDVRCENRHGNRYLLLNPGGSYRSAPAEYYKGINEQFCLHLNLGTPVRR